MEGSINEFQELTAPWGNVTRAVEMLRETVVPGITLKSYSLTGDKIQFAAVAESIDVAIQYVEVLRATPGFTVSYPRPSTEIASSLDLLQAEGG